MEKNIANDWTNEAESAIRMCEMWAAGVLKKLNCQLFLFGSVIYKGGEQFDSVQSDLDIVCLLPNPADALSRLNAMKILKHEKAMLELNMVQVLHRRTCDEPGVSIVTITQFELSANIHKSGARRFFDKNFYYDLTEKRERLGIPNAGIKIIRDERRQVLEYIQQIRNDFLSVAANGTGGLIPYDGQDPLPKSLMRNAAQLVPDPADGEWYDTRQGLEMLHALLRERRSITQEFKDVYEKVSVRRGGRGHMTSLTDEDQLLLSEILFEEGEKISTEDVVTWDIRLVGDKATTENVEEIFKLVTKIIPDASLIGHQAGSLILRVRGPLSGYQLLVDLANREVLAKILLFDEVGLQLVNSTVNKTARFLAQNFEVELITAISKWRPDRGLQGHRLEDSFAEFIQDLLSKTPEYVEVQVAREVFISTQNQKQRRVVDFLLAWNEDNKNKTLAIEVTRLITPSAFTHTLVRLLPLDMRTIFVVLADARALDRIQEDVARLATINSNVAVVQILES